MLAGAADCKNDARFGMTVFELSPHVWGDARDLARRELVRFFFDQKRELPADDQVDLLLQTVPVNSPALPRLEGQLVHPEVFDAQLTSKRDEALLTGVIDARKS